MHKANNVLKRLHGNGDDDNNVVCFVVAAAASAGGLVFKWGQGWWGSELHLTRVKSSIIQTFYHNKDFITNEWLTDKLTD